MPCCHPIVARGYSAGWDPRKADVHVIEATPGSTPSYREGEYLYTNPDPQFLAISGNHTTCVLRGGEGGSPHVNCILLWLQIVGMPSSSSKVRLLPFRVDDLQSFSSKVQLRLTSSLCFNVDGLPKFQPRGFALADCIRA